MQNEFFSAMINDCRNQQDQKSYVAFRQLLIEKPILETSELLLKQSAFSSAIMRQLLRDSYEPIPMPDESNSINVLRVAMSNIGFRMEVSFAKTKSVAFIIQTDQRIYLPILNHYYD